MLYVFHPPSYAAEREYAVGLLIGEFLGLDFELRPEPRADVRIALAGDPGAKSLLVCDVLFQTPESSWLTEAALPRTPLERWDLAHSGMDPKAVSPLVPILFGERLPGGDYVEETEAGLSLGLDVFGGAFLMLTRYEEFVRNDRDARWRFPLATSLAHREGFLARPVVNEYVEILWWAIARLWRLERKSRTFVERPTHDVDFPFYARLPLAMQLRSTAADLLARRNPELALNRALSYVRTRRGNLDADLCNTFDLIMDLSEQRGLRSAFYFIAEEGEDASYSIDDPWIGRLLRRIDQRGHEIGLHGSFDSFDDGPRLRAELKRLVRACEANGIEQGSPGGRQHHLRWANPTTWQIWEDAGLAYDSTLAFPEQAGFRAGVCFEYPVFNLDTRKPLALRERPLVVMDASLLDRHYLGLPEEEALEEIRSLKQTCRLFDGEFTLLWHNSWLLTRPHRALYAQALGA